MLSISPSPGAKHKSMLEGHSAQLRRGRGKLLARAGHKAKRIGNKGSINIQNKAFHCQVCEIYVNSETQLKQVMALSLRRVLPWEMQSPRKGDSVCIPQHDARGRGASLKSWVLQDSSL